MTAYECAKLLEVSRQSISIKCEKMELPKDGDGHWIIDDKAFEFLKSRINKKSEGTRKRIRYR